MSIQQSRSREASLWQSALDEATARESGGSEAAFGRPRRPPTKRPMDQDIRANHEVVRAIEDREFNRTPMPQPSPPSPAAGVQDTIKFCSATAFKLAEARVKAFFTRDDTEVKKLEQQLKEPFGNCDPKWREVIENYVHAAQVLRYGIELDAYRAEQARKRIPNTIHGNALEVHCPVESLGCAYCNPPYDWTLGSTESRRTEQLFLSHIYRWLKPGGVLVLVIPGERLADFGNILASHFRDVRIYRPEAAECVRYKQVVLFGVRRSRRERERMRDDDITRARLQYASWARNPAQLPALPPEPDAIYAVPESGPVQLVYRGLPLDQIEDLLPQSAAYRQAGRILFADPPSGLPRPVIPLHGGQLSLLAVSSMLDGIFGSGNERHLAAWHSVKVVDKTEEEEDGIVTIIERERFSNELTLIFTNGNVATLK